MGEAADDISNLSDAGIRFLAQAFTKEDSLLEQLGSARPEEGSEHSSAYNVDYRTGRHFIHGERVGLGIALFSQLLGNQPDFARSLRRRPGIRFIPGELGLSGTEVVEGLATVPNYVRAERLPYSQTNRLDLGEAELENPVGLVGR